jgi:hypothetical protein
MKRLLLILLCLAACAMARMSLQVDKDRVEAGKTFKLMLIVPYRNSPPKGASRSWKPATGLRSWA